MSLAWLYRWMNKRSHAAERKARRNKAARPRSIRPWVEQLEDRRLMSITVLVPNVQLSLSPVGEVNSYAGVGFKENEVATLAVSVNGEGDPNPGDFQASIQWGDG